MLMQSRNDNFHWVFSSNRCCSLSAPPPEAPQIFTANSPVLCNPCFSYVSSLNLGMRIQFMWFLPFAHPVFALQCTQLGSLRFLFRRCLVVLTEESSKQNRSQSTGFLGEAKATRYENNKSVADRDILMLAWSQMKSLYFR